MSESRIDPERLAALMDGRLNEPARAELLAELADSEEQLGVLAEAAALLAEMNTASPTERGAVALVRHPSRHWRGDRGRWLAIAALVLVTVAVPTVWTRMRARSVAGPAGVVAMLEQHGVTALPSQWNDHPWEATRGGDEAMSAEGRAARVGARLVDLELAVASSDTATARIAREIAALLDPLPASAPAVAVLRDVGRRAGEPPDRMAPVLAQAHDAVLALVGEEPASLGAWVEAARLAASSRDRSFLRDRRSWAVLNRALEAAYVPPSTRAALRRVSALLPGDAPTDQDALRQSLDEALAALAR